VNHSAVVAKLLLSAVLVTGFSGSGFAAPRKGGPQNVSDNYSGSGVTTTVITTTVTTTAPAPAPVTSTPIKK